MQARLNGEVRDWKVAGRRNGSPGAQLPVLSSPQMYSQPTVVTSERPAVPRVVAIKGRNGHANGQPLRVLASPKMYSELTVR